MAFFADMTVYEENPEESTWKLLELKSGFSKITEYTRESIVSFTISTKSWGKGILKYSITGNGKYQKTLNTSGYTEQNIYKTYKRKITKNIAEKTKET